MKKFLIIVVISALHSNIAHGMFDAFFGYVDAGFDYIDKQRKPVDYVNDSKNPRLYKNLLTAINDKEIEELCETLFPDKNNVSHTFKETLGKRVSERVTKLLTCVIEQSLIQDPREQKNIDLFEMIQLNRLIIPDLYLALAIRSLQEQKKQVITVPNTGSKIVDAFLYKISLLDEEERFLLKSKLLDNDEKITLDQQRRRAETYFLSLPIEERDKLLAKMSQKKPIPMPVANVTNQTNNSSNSQSLGNDGGVGNPLPLIPSPVLNPSPQTNHNGNNSKSLDNYVIIGNSLGSENGDGYGNNYYENGEQVTNTNDQVYHG